MSTYGPWNEQIRIAAGAIVADIKADFTDRRGLRHAWESIDEGIRDEIVASWTMTTEKRIRDLLVDAP